MWNDDPDMNRYAAQLTDLAWPILQNLGFSGAVGVVCAIALKVWLCIARQTHVRRDGYTPSLPDSTSAAHLLTP